MWTVDSRSRLRLANKALQQVGQGFLGHIGGDEFDGDLRVENQVLGNPNAPHAPALKMAHETDRRCYLGSRLHRGSMIRLPISSDQQSGVEQASGTAAFQARYPKPSTRVNRGQPVLCQI